MIVSHRHRFIFMKTLKTAGTSVEIALSRVCGEHDVITPLPRADERLRAQGGGLAPQNYESPPLPARLFEHIRALRAAKVLGPEVWDGYHKVAIERNPWDLAVSLYFWVNRHDRALTFEQFLDGPNVALLAQRNFRAVHIKGQLAVDRVLRYERLDEEVAELWRDLSLPGTPELPHAKSGLRAQAGYRQHYTPRTSELVRQHFARQIAEFGYEF